jgi:regulator of sigma E protease
MEISIIPRKDYPKDEGPMGIVVSRFEEKKYPWYQAPFLGTKESMVISLELVKGIGKTLWKLISFQPVGKDVAGPIGIAQMTGSAIKTGENAVLELLGLLSLNLAIVNILPFPALDGGRLLFVVIEGLTGKRIKTHWERYIHQFGMILLLLLMVLVTLNDVVRILAK